MSAAQTVRKWIPRWQENEDQAVGHAAHVGTVANAQIELVILNKNIV
jgi:hypothetical protein